MGFNESLAAEDEAWYMYPTLVDNTTSISGRELAYSLNLPRKSVSGLPVLESVSFGREVHKYSDSDSETIKLGKIYHMRKAENTDVVLDKDSLTAHTFITGSTGAGKSNAVYNIIKNLETNYLIIEPAKGEYKSVFGGKKNVTVLGTNPKKTEILHINPFAFPEDIHVLEHIDRLVEIFNACWPMYAAMPAVLKDAIERVYVKKGWNLSTSECTGREFPCFAELLNTLPEVMDESLYSSDTKSDYSGALITRVKSLTNGIIGQLLNSMYTPEEENQQLFDGKTIVDLSRIGSGETKSLIMGILIMRLQEYRMSTAQEGNSRLSHITVLEEAHNLLRKTSFAQGQEGSNVQGKAVEMLTNAIAEMRTYGEGFIIVDQSPALLDEAVIRNTNTKIILRLPDESDRELVGKSEALTENQITELAKLPLGVAAVYQNDWVESVLCKFDKFDSAKAYEKKDTSSENVNLAVNKYLEQLFRTGNVEKLNEEELKAVRFWIQTLNVSSDTRQLLTNTVNDDVTDEIRQQIAYNVFSGDEIGVLYANSPDKEKAFGLMKDRIGQQFYMNNDLLLRAICDNIMKAVISTEQGSILAQSYAELRQRGGIV